MSKTAVERFQWLHGPAAARPPVEIAESFYDTDTGVGGIGNGTDTPYFFVMDRAPQVIRNKILGLFTPTTTNVPNDYNVGLAPEYLKSYFAGLTFRCYIHAGNTGPSYISVNGLDRVPVTDMLGSPLTGGELMTGMLVEMCFDGRTFRVMNGSAAFDTANEGGTVFDDNLFHSDCSPGTLVYFDAGYRKFYPADIRVPEKYPLGIRGTRNNVIRHGQMLFIGNSLQVGAHYYACITTPGILTTVPTAVYVGHALSTSLLLIDLSLTNDRETEGGVVISPELFGEGTAPGMPVYWDEAERDFKPANSLDPLKGATAFIGKYNDVLTDGVYRYSTDTLSPGKKYFADGGVNAGKLTTTPNAYLIGTAVDARTLLVSISRNEGLEYIANTRSNTFTFGNGTNDQDKSLVANTGNPEGTDPEIKYNVTTDQWEYTNDGVVYFPVGENANSLAGVVPANGAGASPVQGRDSSRNVVLRRVLGSDGIQVKEDGNQIRISNVPTVELDAEIPVETDLLTFWDASKSKPAKATIRDVVDATPLGAAMNMFNFYNFS